LDLILDGQFIFDIGMHKGEDTAFYLSRGFNVVGVEANPQLVELLTNRFADEIKSGQLVIIPKAIAKVAGKITFYINDSQSVWGSIDTEFVERNNLVGTRSRPVTVTTVTMAQIMQTFPEPHYVKIDIEGVDFVCLTSLLATEMRPAFVSIESSVTSPKGNWRDELKLLADNGYAQFKFIDQSKLSDLNGQTLQNEGSPIQYQYEQDSSGPFGDDTPGEWPTYEMAYELAKKLNWQFKAYSRFSNTPSIFVKAARMFKGIGKNDPQSWYDLHARHSGYR
jgi:FkbM family methyltransferase